MVPWWKRLMYGLIGWLVATCTVSLLMSIWILTQSPVKRSDSSSDFLSGVFGAFLLALISAFSVSIIGWLLGIPYVLLVRNSNGWRFRIYLALGSGIGPALLLSPSLFSILRRFSSGGPPIEFPDYAFVCSSAMVSSFTTLIYLLLLRRAELCRKPDKVASTQII